MGDTKVAQYTKYMSDIPMYVQRMQAGIDAALTVDGTDVEQVAIIGYCFGGSGVVQYGLSGSTSAKVAVSFHGSFFTDTAPTVTESIHPYILILSGGDDPAHVNHGFTNFGGDAYALVADANSWKSMKGVLEEKLAAPATNEVRSGAFRCQGFYGLLTVVIALLVSV